MQNNFNLQKEIEQILKDSDISQEAKIQSINKIYNAYNKKIQEDFRTYLLKTWIGAALEIGSAAIPLGGTGQAGARFGQQFLQKSLGKKLSQEIGSGVISGLASGGMFGAGRGLLEEKNLFTSALQDSVVGLFSGGILGATPSAINRLYTGNKLKNYDFTKTNNYKKYKQLASNFYKDFLQGRRVSNKDIGDINITRKGLDEIFSKNPELGVLFPDLINNLKNADFIETNALYKVRKDKTTEKFHTLKKDDTKYFIAEDKLGNKKFYLGKKNTIDQGTPSREEGTSSDGVKTFNESFDIIIPNQIENSNPVAVSATQLIPLTSSIQAGVKQPLKINIEENVDASGHHIFTPTEIGEMTPEEFEKNLPVIEQQLRDGLIKQSAPKIDYTGYVNPVSGDGKIYSRDEIAKLTTDEYIKLEPEIISQLNTIGIPTEKELEKYTAAGDLIYVHPYTRSDGTKVRGYYRAAR